MKDAAQQIKDLLKHAKNKDDNKKTKEVHPQEELRLAKGRRETLENLVIRPNISGRRALGTLELHSNGVRYSSSKGKIDITFNNIKHCFFQPCSSSEMIVLVHFHLKHAIQIGSKQELDFQFIKEAGVLADDIDNKGSRRALTDMDELEQEERERQQKVKLNQRFASFVKKIEEMATSNGFKNIEFEIPFEDLAFHGAPGKSAVKVKPTKSCLVALSEFPCFVMDVNEIELIYFERVNFQLKNFDIVIIKKDFTNFHSISAVPVETLEDIKNYFDDIGIIFAQSNNSLNWKNVLSEIRSDMKEFVTQGAWKFLVDDES